MDEKLACVDGGIAWARAKAAKPRGDWGGDFESIVLWCPHTGLSLGNEQAATILVPSFLVLRRGKAVTMPGFRLGISHVGTSKKVNMSSTSFSLALKNVKFYFWLRGLTKICMRAHITLPIAVQVTGMSFVVVTASSVFRDLFIWEYPRGIRLAYYPSQAGPLHTADAREI